MKKHIFLTGFMGAGKSRIGGLLAKKYNRPFYDSDKLIENESGRLIKEIFEQQGEPAFRKLEIETIKKLSRQPVPAVIALGEGALMALDNFKSITESGLLVYIRSAPEALYERVRHGNKRPLLQQRAKESMLSKIRNLLKERSIVYERADIIFDRDGLSLDEVVDGICRQINHKWEKNEDGLL